MSEKPEATGSPKVATSGHKESFAVLNSCLVDGDAEQRSRERRGRRRALAISIGLQSTALMALLIIPLIGRTERISLGFVTPVPPYGHPNSPVQRPNTESAGGPRTICRVCFSNNISPIPRTHERAPTGDGTEPTLNLRQTIGDTGDGFIPIPNSGPVRPTEEERREPKAKRVLIDHLEPAMLTRRSEPLYPTIPRQLGRSGRVELHAIIATDGSIQSLEVVDGDPLFVRSALDAVSQWRYRPTFLNGVPVEVDTHITVIYTMQR